MSICSNRLEGNILGVYKKTLTTCTSDAILMIIPSVFVFLMWLICFATRSRYIGEKSETGGAVALSTYSPPAYSNPTFNLDRPTLQAMREKRESGGPKRVLRIVLAGGLTLLGVGAIVLHCYEIAQMSSSQLGIGLLPIIPFALLLITITILLPTHASNKHPRRARPHFLPWALTLFAFTIGMCVVTGIRLNSLISFGETFGDKYDLQVRTVTVKDKAGKETSKKENVEVDYTLGLRKLVSVILCIMYGIYSLAYASLWYLDIVSGRSAY